MKKTILMFIALFLLASSGIAQKKYAILFGGEDNADPNNPMFAYKSGQDFNQQEAVWNDTYLMWELLINNGFNNDDIIVLYHTGEDYVRTAEGDILNERYDPREWHSDLFSGPSAQLTKKPSTKAKLQEAITEIIDDINEEDFFVFLSITHGHPNYFRCNDYNQNNPATYVTANELSKWLAPINCKKLILMQQCASGGIIDELKKL